MVHARPLNYEPYSLAQCVALGMLLAELTDLATLRYICGHEDITRRKSDPGPAFPWSSMGLGRVGLVRMARDWNTGEWGVEP